uniref:Venom S1 protease 33 n=1 Tax=Oncocephalus sp. TaxID=2944721 RepID=A0AB38ZEP6_9HEMI
MLLILPTVLAISAFTHNANGNTLQPITGDIIISGDIINTDINGSITPNIHYKYKFKGEKDKSMSLRCKMNVDFTRDPKGSCTPFKLHIQSGTRIRWHCNSHQYFNFFSETDQMEVTIDTGHGITGGNVSCKVWSIHKVVHSNYKNVASEEVDSSEFGQRYINGPKKTTCDCGWSNKEIRRILFGKDTGKHEFPWSVSLQRKSSNSHFCGGSIITPYHIISAAHCTNDKVAEKIYVVYGSNNRSDNSISAEIKKIYNHDYNKTMYINDISILELTSKITYTQFIGPVCLPTRDPDIVGKYVTAMGWGRLHKSEYATRDVAIMKKTHLRVIDIESCSLDWSHLLEVDDPKFICTWSNHTDICIGDSGGPVVWHDPEIHRYTLQGLPAICDGCNLKNPSGHTAVYYFYDWIKETIENSVQPEAKKAQICTKID